MLIEKNCAEIYVKYCHFNLDIHWFEAYKRQKQNGSMRALYSRKEKMYWKDECVRKICIIFRYNQSQSKNVLLLLHIIIYDKKAIFSVMSSFRL